MLEKIGLPPKPSVRGNNWVVDASHCQGCSSQFTFINRKHHCRRCGGLFCNSCTQQRMMLRGQGDSPVRICEPCKKLEEAARFEMRYGQKNRTSRGGSKVMSRDEDEILNQILGNDGKEFVSSRRGSTIDTVSGTQRANSIASSSSVQELTTQDEDRGNLSAEETSHPPIETGSASPEELRQQALDEKKKYKNLKAEGKSGEALKAFKRGKELERQAGSLELLLRKNRKKALSSTSMTETQKIKDDIKGSGRINKLSPQMSKDKDDLAAELRDLGWSDMDLRDAEKKPASMSLEGELSSLLGDASRKAKTEKGISGIDKTQVIAHKKRALELKREGNLTEAKEELKRAKVLEKQLEEQEFLADAEDSDDELSSLIRSLDNDKQDDLSVGYKAGPGVDFDPLVGLGDDIGANSNFDVTDEDMDDPEMASALKSLGWAEEVVSHEYIEPRFVPIDREALSHEIQSLKRDAVNQKRAGNTVEAMALLKKAKALEKDLENYDSKGANLLAQSSVVVEKGSSAESAENASKSRRVIQKELLELKKRALALRREGRVDEADEELKKGKVLEQQLEGIDNASKSKPTDVYFNDKPSDSSTAPDLGDEEDGDVTDQDMHDPTYISLLRNLGWNDEDDGNSRIPSKPSKQNKRLSVQISGSSGKSKGEIQRELLGLKRKALALRRHGETEEAEEVLKMTKVLEAQLAEIEAPKKEAQAEINEHLGSEITGSHLNNAVDEGDEVPVSEEDMHDGALLSMLNNLGWKEEVETESKQAKSSEQVLSNSVHSDGTLVVGPKRSKREIQKELLGLKRKALSLRRQGETEEAEEVTRMAKLLEAQMEEIEDPKKELDIDASNKKESETSVSLITDEKHQSLKDVMELNKGLAQEAVYSKEKMIERPTSLRWKEINSDKPRSSDISIEDNRPLLVDLGPPYESKTTEATGQSSNLIDLLTGEDWINPQTSVHNSEDKRNFSPLISSLSDSPIYLESQKSPTIDFVKTEVKVHANEKMSMDEPKSAPVIVSQNDQSTLRQDVLAHKRKAVALKREGKLAEAREELRQAKLLEKSLADEKPKPSISFSDVSSSTSIGQPQQKSSNLAPKPLSGRDRFKLQQESLSHKRLALKLRREGRTDEADAEFELAKALENQLEEFADSNKSGVETVDDVGVEDFLDPQLLSALKAIGLEDPSTVSRGPERVEPSKSVIGKNENSSQERIQLEERIKAEKVKAVNLKRSGKQAEALDSLRKAKVLEKKLNSLASV